MDRDYQDAIRREVDGWPGASVAFELRSKHGQAKLRYRDKTRFVVLPASPSDGSRGAKNSIADVRRELAAMGAARAITQPRAPKAKRQATRRVERDPLAHIEAAPVKANPFDALAAMRFPDPAPPVPAPPPTRLQRAVAWVKSILARTKGDAA